MKKQVFQQIIGIGILGLMLYCMIKFTLLFVAFIFFAFACKVIGFSEALGSFIHRKVNEK